MVTYSQHSFVGGFIDRALMGRQDLAKYYDAASELENVRLSRQGHVAKRRGTNLSCRLNNLTGWTTTRRKYFKRVGEVIPCHYCVRNWTGVEFNEGWISGFYTTNGRVETNIGFNFQDFNEKIKIEVTFKTAASGNISGTIMDDSSHQTTIYVNSDGYFVVTFVNQKTGEAHGFTCESLTTVKADTIYKIVISMGGYIAEDPEDGIRYETFAGSVDIFHGDGSYFYSSEHPIIQVKPFCLRSEKTLIFGNGAQDAWTGSIDLTGCYVSIDDEIKWQGVIYNHWQAGDLHHYVKGDYYVVQASEQEYEDNKYYFYIDTIINNQDACRLVPFLASLDRGYHLLFMARRANGDQAETSDVFVITNDGVLCELGDRRAYYKNVPSGYSPISIAHDRYDVDKLNELGFFQSGDTLFIAHEDVPFAKIYRTDHTHFTYETINISQLGRSSLPSAPTGVRVTGDKFTGEGSKRTVWYKVTAVVDGLESPPSEAKAFEYSLPWTDGAKATIEWDAVAGAEYYNVYKKESSEYGLIGTTKDDNDPNTPTEPPSPDTGEGEGEEGSTASGETRTYLQDDYIQPDAEFSPPRYSEHFHSAGDFPSCAAMYQQRLALAATKRHPFTFYLSTTGDIYNFNEHTALRDDDAIEATVPATEFPRINHMVLARDLVLFCENGIWVVSPIAGTSLSYQTIQCLKQNSIGSAKSIPPIYCGEHIVSVDIDRRTVRGCKYSFASDALEMQDLSVFATDLFRSNPIKRIAWLQNPEMMLYCVLEDGSLATLTYMAEQNVYSWAHHTLGGGVKVMDAAANKSQADGNDELSLLVDNDGVCEVWHLRTEFDDMTLEKQLCLDGCVHRSGDILTEEDFTADKVVIRLDTGEHVKLFSQARKLSGFKYFVGYPFTSRVTTVYPQIQGQASMQLSIANLKNVDCRLVDSSDFYVVSKSLAHMRNYWAKVSASTSVEAGALKLFTGDVSVRPTGTNTIDPRVTFIHEGTLPWALTYFALDYSFDPKKGGRG